MNDGLNVAGTMTTPACQCTAGCEEVAASHAGMSAVFSSVDLPGARDSVLTDESVPIEKKLSLLILL